MAPQGSIGFRWDKSRKWNLEPRDGKSGDEITMQLSLLDKHDEVADVAFPYFGGIENEFLKVWHWMKC